jgi:hypothetical protein
MAEKMATAAWQGIALKVPADWSMVGISGDEKKGYFRVDGPVAAALEVRWSQALGKSPDLEAKGREFLATIEKSCKKGRVPYSGKIKAEKGAGYVGFNWRADRIAQGRLSYCAKCDRVTIAQVIWSKAEDASHLSPVILGSLSDHRDDGWTDWGLYGLEFAVPPGYKVEKNQLMSAYLALTFRKGPRTLAVQRWGLVSALLGGGTLEEWYKKDVLPDVKGYKARISEETVAGHEGLVIQGRRGGIKQAARAAAYSLTLHKYPALVSGYAWNCDKSNRLFSVWASHNEGEGIAEKVIETIRCH